MRLPSTLACVLALPSLVLAAPQEWKAPASAAARVNPIATSPEVVGTGAELYGRVCAGCHGATGLGDGMMSSMLRRKPKDLSTATVKQSDGELFWKIRNGNEFMSGQAKALSEEDTWRVVHFVRSLQAPEPVSEAWASFPTGAWVEIHSEHEMVRDGDSKKGMRGSRLTVGGREAGALTLRLSDLLTSISKETVLSTPSVNTFPGVRAPGQSPNAIFASAPESGEGSLVQQPVRRDVKTKLLDEESIEFAGQKRTARRVQRTWQTGPAEKASRHALTVWIVDGLELPARSIHEVDGELQSESRLEDLQASVTVGKRQLDCILMITRSPTDRGMLEQRCWSSPLVPGFQVKMEWELNGDGFQLTGKEFVTDFSATPAKPSGSR